MFPGRPSAQSGLFRLFRSKWPFFASSSSMIAFVATKQQRRSAIRTKTPCGVRYAACHVQVALLLSFLGPPWSQWRSDWCALGCSAAVAFGCVCLSHVSGWLMLVEVFAVIPLGVSCFLSCRVGRHFVARYNVGAQAGWFTEQVTVLLRTLFTSGKISDFSGGSKKTESFWLLVNWIRRVVLTLLQN